MTRNYVSRTIAEALERIKRDHGPDATIIKVWEFQRWNELHQLETWVGVTVGEAEPKANPAWTAAPRSSRNGSGRPEEFRRRIRTLSAEGKREPPAGDKTPDGPQPMIRTLPRFQKPIDPSSPSQGQVLKATFQPAHQDKPEPAPTEPAPEAQVHPASDTIGPHPYTDVGGLDRELVLLREMVEYPLRYPEMFQKVGIEAPKGVLLCGPAGCGKTLLARSIARTTAAHFQIVNGPELIGAHQGESERNLRQIFEEAAKKAPSIIFFDEIDAIAPSREEASGPEKRLVTQLLTLLDGTKSRGQIIVIASTNLPNQIDPALRRPGRFDREIWIGPPNQKARQHILRVHTRYMALEEDVNLDDLAARTHGFVGADIAHLCREAGLYAIREALLRLEPHAPTDPRDPARDKKTELKELLNHLRVGRAHFEAAIKDLKPASLRNQQAEIPKVRWREIGGLEKVKRELEEAVLWPIRHPELFRKADVQPPRGILLAGPPGTGKTLLARALANESGINFISVKGPSLVSKYVGESEKAVRDLFAQARQAAPCILFFDEIDAIAPVRGADLSSCGFADRLVAQLLVEMDGIEKLNQVLVLGATNRPDAIDPALRRPGRFDRVITIPRPDVSSRLDIFKVHTARKPLDPAVDLPACAAQTEGFSGADLESVCRLAALAAIRRALLQPHPTTRSASQAPGDSAVIYPADFHAAIAEVRHQIQKQRIEDVAMQATRDAGDRTVEPLPASASQLFQAYQEVQRERVRDTTASFRLN